MGYKDMWRTLDDLLKELRQKGEAIPAVVMNDLHSAKTMIQILQADPKHTENIPRVETYLEGVEFRLISVAQGKFGPEYAERWMERLREARKKVDEEDRAMPRFVPGIPRGESWVRVQISKETSRRHIEKLARESMLSHKTQENGYILIWGKNEKVKSFIENLRKAQNSSKSGLLRREE